MTAAAILGIALNRLVEAMNPGPSFVVAARTAPAKRFVMAVALAVSSGAVFIGLVPADAPLRTPALLVAILCANAMLWCILEAPLFATPNASRLHGHMKTGIDRAFDSLIALFGLRIALV